MQWFRFFDPAGFLVFTLILMRVSGLVMTAPIYGTSDVPTQVRVLLAFVLALLVAPSQLGARPPPPTRWSSTCSSSAASWWWEWRWAWAL